MFMGNKMNYDYINSKTLPLKSIVNEIIYRWNKHNINAGRGSKFKLKAASFQQIVQHARDCVDCTSGGST